MHVFNYLTVNSNYLRPDVEVLYKKEKDLLNALFQEHQPDLVVISAN